MAKKKTWTDPIDKHTAWDGDSSTGNLPVAGSAVETFLKDSLEGKAGCFYKDEVHGIVYVFADEENRDLYLADTSREDLIITTFPIVSKYTAYINLLTPIYNIVKTGTAGAMIQFTFSIEDTAGNITNEDVTCTYTIVSGTITKTVTQKYSAGVTVMFPLDEYLRDGVNNITIHIKGDNTLTEGTAAVVYTKMELAISSDYDISTQYNPQTTQFVAIPLYVYSSGVKMLEWYLDGVQLPFESEDEVMATESTLFKSIDISSLTEGHHSVQARFYITISGTKYYSDIIYRDIIVHTTGTNAIVALGFDYTAEDVISSREDFTIRNVAQFNTCYIDIATYSPQATQITTVVVDGSHTFSYTIQNNEVLNFSYVFPTVGEHTLLVSAGSTEYAFKVDATPSTMNIQEITSGLELALDASGRSNSATDYNVWTYGDYSATFTGFAWNKISGWLDNGLRIVSGSSVSINYVLLKSTIPDTGFTAEFEFETFNVKSDDAVICNITDQSGVGLMLTASEASLTSTSGASISRRFAPGQRHRITFVINRRNAARRRMMLLYIDGVIAAAADYGSSGNFTVNKNLAFSGSADAEIILYSIRTYGLALTDEQVLNNLILYRPTVTEMLAIYNRNNIYEDNDATQLSINKIAGTLPVMLVTGNIPVLEDTTSKSTQIIVGIDFRNLQNPELAWHGSGFAMRPQGTSSLRYPKKNFRDYTKYAGASLYNYQDVLVPSGTYAFQPGAQSVSPHCEKADFAESSSTHNTGIARLWNDVLKKARIDEEYRLRTQAQEAALASGYEYDVRTTVDGYPIAMFYRRTVNDPFIFMGKYNHNNDKSTESVYGFVGIPGFDNTNVRCFEVLDNADPIALFTDISGFYTQSGGAYGWESAFEARYPDVGSSVDTTSLYALCSWINSCKDDQAKFDAEVADHFDLYKLVAYYIYLMRFGAVDQTVKNAMLTTEDGQHWYYINYDNDTINGLINTGELALDPDVTRETRFGEGYAYAGHDSVLWNRFEGSSVCMGLVPKVDDALSAAGLNIADVLDMFNNKQAGKWCERIYNLDAQYKYIGPYVNEGKDFLYMCQGNRTSHRTWWLSRRFHMFDAMFQSGEFRSKSISLAYEGSLDTVAVRPFATFTAGTTLRYSYSVNNVVKDTTAILSPGDIYTFSLEAASAYARGNIIYLYCPNDFTSLDLSPFSQYLVSFNASSVVDANLEPKLRTLVFGSSETTNTQVTSLNVDAFKYLETLDITNMKGVHSSDLIANLNYLRTFIATGSGLTEFTTADGNNLETLYLPDVRVLSLLGCSKLTIDGLHMEGVNNLRSLTIKNCPQLANSLTALNTLFDFQSLDYIYIDSIHLSRYDSVITLLSTVIQSGVDITLKGQIDLIYPSYQLITQIIGLFGTAVFDPNNELYFYVRTNTICIGLQPLDTLQIENSNGVYAGRKYKILSYTFFQGRLLENEEPIYSVGTGGVLDSTAGTVMWEDQGRTNYNYSSSISAFDGQISGARTVNVNCDAYPASQFSLSGSRAVASYGTTVYVKEPSNYVSSQTTFPRYIWSMDADLAAIATLEAHEKYVKVISNGSAGSGVLTCTVMMATSDIVVTTLTRTMYALEPGIIMTTDSNPEVFACFANYGLVDDPADRTYITAAYAATLTATDFMKGPYVSGSKTSIFYNSNIEGFEEFQYFTGVTELRYRFFYDCSSLVAITIPSSCESIGANAFSGCSSLSGIDLNQVTSIDAQAFTTTDLSYIHGDIALTDVEYNAFDDCVRHYPYQIDITVPNLQLYQLEDSFYTKVAIQRVSDAGSSYRKLAPAVPATSSGYHTVLASLVGDGALLVADDHYYLDPSGTITTQAVSMADTEHFKYVTARRVLSFENRVLSNMSDAKFHVTASTGRTILDSVVTPGEFFLVPNRLQAAVFSVEALTEYPGYIKPDSYTWQNVMNRIDATQNYTIDASIGIVDNNNAEYTQEEWEAAVDAGDVTAADAQGIFVRTAFTTFILGTVRATSVMWSNITKDLITPTKYAAQSDAILDYNGRKNTTDVYADIPDYSTNPNIVKGFIAANLSSEYYVPSLGQLKLILDNREQINTLLTAIQSTMTITTNTFLSSSCRTISTLWSYNGANTGTISYDSMTQSRYCLFVKDFE